jgi:hypothetical protein
MSKCYDNDCQTEVEEEFSFCPDCQLKHYPHHPLSLRSTLKRFEFNQTHKETTNDRKDDSDDLWDLTIDQIRDKEKVADAYLKDNISIKTSDPKRWGRLMERYSKIVHVMNMKSGV